MLNARFAVTGGPGAGKSTVLLALAERGYAHVPESARAIIRRRLERGLSPRPPAPQFAHEILQMDIERYRDTRVGEAPVFFDRGVLDALSMLDEYEALSSDELEAHVQEFRFNQVAFVMPPCQAIYRCDTERDQSFVQSVSVFDDLRNWYARWGYQLVEVPRVAVDERVDFLIETAAAVLTSRPGRLTG